MSLPGKGLEGHKCPTIVTSWWHHLEHHELCSAKKQKHFGQGGMRS